MQIEILNRKKDEYREGGSITLKINALLIQAVRKKRIFRPLLNKQKNHNLDFELNKIFDETSILFLRINHYHGHSDHDQ